MWQANEVYKHAENGKLVSADEREERLTSK